MTETMTTTLRAMATHVAVSAAQDAVHYADVRYSLYVFGLFIAFMAGLLLLVFAASLRGGR